MDIEFQGISNSWLLYICNAPSWNFARSYHRAALTWNSNFEQ